MYVTWLHVTHSPYGRNVTDHEYHLLDVDSTRGEVDLIDLISRTKHSIVFTETLMDLMYLHHLTCMMDLIYNEEQIKNRLPLSAGLCTNQLRFFSEQLSLKGKY